MVIIQRFQLNDRLYVISEKGYTYVIYFNKDGKQITKRIKQRTYDMRYHERYNY